MDTTFITASQASSLARSHQQAANLYDKIKAAAKAGKFFLEVPTIPTVVIDRLKSDGYKVNYISKTVTDCGFGVGDPEVRRVMVYEIHWR